MERNPEKVLYFIAFFLLSFFIGACTGGGGGSGGGSTVPKPATVPANLDLTPGNEQITLYWDSVADAASYTIYWSRQSGVTPANGTAITNVQPGYVHTSLNNGQSYSYVITAITSAGESDPSIGASAIPVGTPINGSFTDSNLQSCIDNYATTNNWQYVDQVSGQIDCSNQGVVDLNGIELLTAVTQINLNQNAIQDITLLGQLFNLTLLDISFNDVQSSGINITDLTRLASLSTLNVDGNINIQCSHITALLSFFGTGVLDVATADPGINCTADPSELPTTPPPGVELQAWPTGMRAIPGDTHITLHWFDAIGATSYNIYWALTPGVTLSTGTLIENVSTSYVHSGLNNFVPYYYIVTAIVNGVESQASEEVSAEPSDVGILLAGLFTDSNLQTCIDQMAAPSGWTFAHEIVGAIDCSSQGIQSLAGIGNLSEVTSLNLLNNNITDLSPLSSLLQLTRLYINNNSITDLSALSALTSLNFINARNNTIVDVAPLAGLTAMRQLYLNNNDIIDVSPLANLVDLNILDLRDNAVGGEGVGRIDSLATLTNAESIRLTGNQNINCVELIALVTAVGASVVDLSASTSAIDCSVPPATPQNLNASPGNQRNILTWDSVIGATSYNLYWSNSPAVSLATATQITDVSPGYNHAGLINGTPYYYVVTAVNNIAESAISQEVLATPTLITLDNLFADSNLQTCVDEVALINNWTTADQVTGRLNCSMRSIVNINGLEHLTSVTELSLNSNNISDITPLSWLSSLTSLSIYSNQIANILPLRNLSNLTDLFISNNLITTVSPLANLTSLLTLDLSNNQIAGHGIGRIDLLSSLTSTTNLRLTDNADISCNELSTLIAALSTGVVDLGVAQEGVNCISPSLIPSGLQAVSGNNQITISWNPVNGIDGYRLYWSTSSGVTPSTGSVIDVASASYLHAGLINDTVYYYVITTIDNGNESGPSSQLAGIPSASGVSLSGLIPDSTLSGCVTSIAGSNGWKLAHEITGSINCSSGTVSDLSGMEFLTALETLRLGGNGIQDISALAGLTNITFLDLFNNNIDDISALTGLTNLERLYLHDNNITDVSALSGLPNLNYLILDGNNVTDLSPLASVPTLTRVFARNNNVSNVAGLAGLTEMIELYLNGNIIVDVSALGSMSLLQKLDLRNNALGGLGVGRIDALVTLSTVSQIWISGNNNVSCAELTTLVDTLGIAALDVGSPIDGINCTGP